MPAASGKAVGGRALGARFPDIDDETIAAQYQREDRRPAVLRGALLFAGVFLVYGLVACAVSFLFAEKETPPALYWCYTAAYLLQAPALVALVRASDARGWASAAVEAAVFAIVCLTWLSYLPVTTRGLDALWAAGAVDMSPLSVLRSALWQMEVLLHLAAIAALMPMRSRTFAALTFTVVGAGVANDLVVLTRAHSCVEELLAPAHERVSYEIVGLNVALDVMCSVFAGVLVFINAHLNRQQRTAHAAQQSLESAAAEREAMLQAEAEQTLQLRTAEAARKSRSLLIRVVMHDLRSPLLSVANSAAILEELLREADSEARECCEAIVSCSNLMQNIVSDMLDFERIDSGRLMLVPAPFLLASLLDSAHHTFAAMAKSSGVALAIEPLPPTLRNAAFVGDERRLQQCLNNVLSNAIKFTEAAKSGGKVRVRLALDEEAGPVPALVVTVEDGGLGLTEEELRTVNDGEAFTQVGQGQLQGRGGTGLGLTITREMLQMHSGSRLRLSSPGRGKGATCELVLRLPRATPEATDALITLRDVAAGGLGTGAGSKSPTLQFPPDFRVLHVEDDAILRRSMELRIFRKLGVIREVAVNGEEAIRLILTEGRRYDVVLMDNQMPVVNGEECARRLREGGFEGQIVGMTGDPAGCPERATFEGAGLDECINKDNPGMRRLDEILRMYALPHLRTQLASGTDTASSVGSQPGQGQHSRRPSQASDSPKTQTSAS